MTFFTRFNKHQSYEQFKAWGLALITLMITFAVTRVTFIVVNWYQVSANSSDVFEAMAFGHWFDLTVSLWVLFISILIPLCLPQRIVLSRIWKWAMRLMWFAFVYALLFLGVVEYFFFDEFSSRFNSVAVDYLIFPHEIFVNLWDTYPVWQVLVAVFLLTAVILTLMRKKLSAGLEIRVSRATRAIHAIVVLAFALFVTVFANPRLDAISNNRVVQQIALNGLYSFTVAALTNELDYDAYYARTDDLAAFTRVRELIKEPNSDFLQPPESLSIDRSIIYPGPARKLNIVIVLEESFGAKFVRSLDSTGPGCTPEFEKLADQGLFFTNIYATGNRTVRGMEGVLLSFPPIPGQSIVRRPGGRHVFSLPSLLKANGYQTSFVYGGYSYFDDMKEFTLANGFERVLDRTDFAKKTFTTIWGVCDEDLFDNALTILDSMNQTGRPFFSLILTVSNHSPYTYPEGRIAADPKEQQRENVVQYMDYALGRFMRNAESHPFFDSTIFVVLGDHGARVYGSQKVPMKSYRIPLLIYAPSILGAGQRNGILGSQIDIAPTLMGILNLSYASQFFGRDLLRLHPDSGVALMSHNRDVALLRGGNMGVLGIQQEEELWVQDASNHDITLAPIKQDTAIIADAIAYFQTAYFLYMHNRLHPLDQSQFSNANGTVVTR